MLSALPPARRQPIPHDFANSARLTGHLRTGTHISGKSVNQEFAYRRIVVCLRSVARRFPERRLAGVSPALPGWITCDMAI